MASRAIYGGRCFWSNISDLIHKLLFLLGVLMASKESSAIATDKARSIRPGGKKPDPIKGILGKRPSGKQLREILSVNLPAMKAKRVPTKEVLIGRPSKYDEGIGEQVLQLMSEGRTLTEACDDLKIKRSTVYSWAERIPSFSATLARAQSALAEHAFTQAASVPRELYARVQAGEQIEGAHVAAARLLTDSMRWYAERLNPGRFAPQSKQSIELTGANGGPIQTASVVIDSRSLSPDARDALRYALEAARAAPTLEHDEGEGVDD